MLINLYIDEEAGIIMSLGKDKAKARGDKLGMEPVQVYQLRAKKINDTRDSNQTSKLKDEFPPIARLGRDVVTEKEIQGAEGKNTTAQLVIDRYGSVNIYVDGGFDRRSGKESDRDGVKIALAARKLFKSAIAEMPNGTLLYNHPVTGDGLGVKRQQLYASAGFSKGTNIGSKMLGVVKDGKIVPITAKQYALLKKAGHTVDDGQKYYD